MSPNLNDYLGKFDGGILASIGILHEGVYYDAMFYYTENKMIITPSRELLESLGSFIEDHPLYLELMRKLINLVDPYEKIIDQLSEVDPNDFLSKE